METYNKHITQKEKVDRIETFGYLPIKGDVNLKNPEVNWWYIEYYGLDNMNVPEEPMDIVFGKWVSWVGVSFSVPLIKLKKKLFLYSWWMVDDR